MKHLMNSNIKLILLAQSGVACGTQFADVKPNALSRTERCSS